MNDTSKQKRQKVIQRFKALAEKGFPMGKITIKHRSELYTRK